MIINVPKYSKKIRNQVNLRLLLIHFYVFNIHYSLLYRITYLTGKIRADMKHNKYCDCNVTLCKEFYFSSNRIYQNFKSPHNYVIL